MRKVMKLALVAGLVTVGGAAARADVDIRNDNEHCAGRGEGQW